MLFIVGYNVLPNFSLNADDFELVSGIVSSIRRETYEEKRPKKILFHNAILRQRLIVTIADRDYHEYYISDMYKKYWPQLLDYNVTGKEIKLYLGTVNQQEDPYRLELDNKMIYGTDIRYNRSLIIIAFTLALTIYNLYHYFEPDKKKHSKAVNLKNNNTGIKSTIIERLKHYFLNK